MPFPVKLFKSSGVPVTAAVHRLLAEANQARADGHWLRAAEGYEAALKRDPGLDHIWLQYGHALKEAGRLDTAEAAYAQAAGLKPSAAEPHLHIGHVAKLRGDRLGARQAYLRAAELEPHNADVAAELRTFVAQASSLDASAILQVLHAPWGEETDAGGDPAAAARSALQALASQWAREGVAEPDALSTLDAARVLIDRVGAAPRPAAGAAATALVFDVSDLVGYFRDSRLPTGIQRVQIETITNALAMAGEVSVQVCCFAQDRDAWIEIPRPWFVDLCRMSLASGDVAAPDWSRAFTRLQLHLVTAEPFVFPDAAVLINLGTSWWISNYFLAIRQAKTRSGGPVRYAPFVHDLIPLLAPACCAKGLTRDFIGWLVGVFAHADVFLVNSRSTQRDLLEAARALGHPLEEAQVHVIPLDADSRRSSDRPARSDLLAAHALDRTPFVLFVSTIEARKNHVLAFDAWLELVRLHGLKRVPKLVCVGKRGWLEAEIFAKLETHETLRDRVVMLSGLSDADLDLLYQRCLFTLYPSTYEGWGLPVTESLCHGKTPLISNGTSLPEAGGPFAVYFEAGSAPHLVQALQDLIYDPAYRAACETRIAQEFKPRRWSEVAGQVVAALADASAFQPGRNGLRLPEARLGAFHSLAHNTAVRIWPGMRSAEAFRDGPGWWGPDDFGCWTKSASADLHFGLPAPHDGLRLYLALQAPPATRISVEVELDGVAAPSGLDLDPHARRWLTVDIPACDDANPCHRIRLIGDRAVDLSTLTDGRDQRVVVLGVEGFFLCETTDAAARSAFLEAVVLGNLASLAFNREPRAARPPGAGSSALFARGGEALVPT